MDSSRAWLLLGLMLTACGPATPKPATLPTPRPVSSAPQVRTATDVASLVQRTRSDLIKARDSVAASNLGLAKQQLEQARRQLLEASGQRYGRRDLAVKVGAILAQVDMATDLLNRLPDDQETAKAITDRLIRVADTVLLTL